MKDPLFGLLKQGPHCPESDAVKLSHHQAWMKLFQVTNNGFVKGWYQENQDVISDQCFGDVYEPVFTAWHGIKTKVHEDFWSLNLAEVKEAVDMSVDALFQNMEACQWERIGDDAKNWCMENPEVCMIGAGMEDRFFDNMFDIFGKLFDLYKMASVNDSCYSDMEKMGEIYRFAVDMGELSASLSGFDYKWDPSVERTHIKRKQFHTWVKDTIVELKDQDILEMIAPDLKDLIDWILSMVDDFEKSVEGTMNALFAPVKHHKGHHNGEHKKHHSMNPLDALFAPAAPQPHHHQADPFAGFFQGLDAPFKQLNS